MKVKSILEFQESIEQTFDKIIEGQETLAISINDNTKVVMMPLRIYNGIQETLYQSSSKTNWDRLIEAVEDINRLIKAS